MADIDLKTATPDTSLPTTGFLFGADSQASASPSVYSTQTVATTLLGSTSLTGATITADAPVLDLAQTWNAGAVTFTGLKFNATDTASAAASLLMDLQVGGSSRFSVGKTGNLKLGVSPTGTNQAGTNVIIAGSQGTGTGAGGSIIFQVAPAGSSGTAQNALVSTWQITGSGHLTLATDNTYDIGASAATRPRSIFVGTDVSVSASTKIDSNGPQLESSKFFRWSSSAVGGTTDVVIGRGGTSGTIVLGNKVAYDDFNRLMFGGTTSSFPALKRSSTALETKLADDSAYAPHAMQYLDVTDGVTAPASATGRARIYVDTADGDLKVIFADGTVKTIVTDT